MKNRLSVSRVLAVVALVLAWSGPALAVRVQLSTFPANPGVLPGGGFKVSGGTAPSTFTNPTPQRAWVDGVYGGVPGTIGRDTVTVPGPAGAPLPITADQTASLIDIAAAAAQILTPEIGGAVTAAQILYHAYRIFNESDSPAEPGGALARDPGVLPVQGAGTLYSLDYGQNFPWESSMSAAAEDLRKTFDPGTCSNNPGLLIQWVTQSATPDGAVVYSLAACPGFSGSSYRSYYFHTMQGATTSCPASIDASDPRYSIPSGSPVGPDGMCPTGRYNHVPITPAVAAGLLANPPAGYQMPSPQLVGDAARQVIAGGGQLPADITTSGPASQVGQPSTSTQNNPDGSTVTKTDTPTYNFNYAGDTVSYSTTHSIVTNSCTGAGACSASTTTTNAPAAATTPPVDPCTANPTSLGCTQLGALPVAERIPGTDVPIVFAPVAFSGAAACPAPYPLAFSVSGKAFNFSIDTAPLCGLMSTLAPIFTALFACAAALIFMDGIKSL